MRKENILGFTDVEAMYNEFTEPSNGESAIEELDDDLVFSFSVGSVEVGGTLQYVFET